MYVSWRYLCIAFKEKDWDIVFRQPQDVPADNTSEYASTHGS